MRLLKSFDKLFGTRKHNRRPQRQRRQPLLEALEDRLVPTIVIQPNFGPEVLDSTSQDHALQSPTLYLLYWGSYWQTTQGQMDKSTLTQNIQTILNSPYVTGLVQYGGDGHALLGSPVPFVDSTTAIPTVPGGAFLAAGGSSAAERSRHPPVDPHGGRRRRLQHPRP